MELLHRKHHVSCQDGVNPPHAYHSQCHSYRLHLACCYGHFHCTFFIRCIRYTHIRVKFGNTSSTLHTASRFCVALTFLANERTAAPLGCTLHLAPLKISRLTMPHSVPHCWRPFNAVGEFPSLQQNGICCKARQDNSYLCNWKPKQIERGHTSFSD